MSQRATGWVLGLFANEPDSGLNPGLFATLLALADAHRHKTRLCCPSMDTVAKQSYQGERTVYRQIDALEALGLVKRLERRGKGGRRTSNEYLLRVDFPDGFPDDADEPPASEDAPQQPANLAGGQPANLTGGLPANLADGSTCQSGRAPLPIWQGTYPANLAEEPGFKNHLDQPESHGNGNRRKPERGKGKSSKGGGKKNRDPRRRAMEIMRGEGDS